MKTTTFLFTLFTALVLAATGFASSPEEDRVIAAVREAFTSKQAKPIVDLYYWEGVPEDLKAKTAEFLVKQIQVNGAVTDLKFVEADSKGQSEFTREGVTYRTTMPIIRRLEVHFADAGSIKNSRSFFPIGEKAGKLYFVTFAPVK